KIAGIKLCESYRRQYGCNFISAMPTNLYGPNDNYNLQNSHVLPALVRKFHEAKLNNTPEVSVWGSGKPYREFLHVDDLAEACYFLMENYDEEQFLNVGYGSDLTISELAELAMKTVGYKGRITYDSSKPDGTPRKLMDSSRIHKLGWKAKIDLVTGLASTYQEFLKLQNTQTIPNS
ncbi:MAG: NAD-dependent epimerase/dehydratase family protein, partial [Flavobacterium sp.]